MIEAHCKNCGDIFLKEFDETWKRLCWDCWRENKGYRSKPPRPSPKPSSAPIDDEMIRRLIYLCHPDKHQNSQAANIATQWLLTLKK
jgi:hypothetical protein